MGSGLGPRLGAVALVLVVGILVLLPVGRLQGQAFDHGFSGYARALNLHNISGVALNTIVLAFGSLAIAMVFGTGLALAAEALPQRLGWMRVLPVIPIIVPAVASVIGWAFLLSPRPGYLNSLLRRLPWWDSLSEGPLDVYSMLWIVLITGFSLASFVYLLVGAGLKNVSSESIEAASVCGSSRLKIAFGVVIPMLRPTLTYAAGVALLLALGQFTAPLLLGLNGGVKVLTVEMYLQMSQTPVDYSTAAALGSPLLAFGILVVLGQRKLIGDSRRFVTHGGKAFRSQRRPSRSAAVAIGAYFVGSTLLPLTAIAFVSFSPFWSGNLSLSNLTTANFEKLFARPTTLEAITNSLVFSFGAALICLPIGFLAATILVKWKDMRVVRTTLDLLITAPLGIPAIIFGAGFLMAYAGPPFNLYGTSTVMILVYVTLMLPFATRMQAAALLALGDTYSEASRVSGGSALRTQLQIVLPLLRPSIAGAAAIMFVLLTHEFTASLLVRASSTQVMGTLLYDYWSNGSYPAVAAVALVMTGVTGVGVVLALALGGRDALTRM